MKDNNCNATVSYVVQYYRLSIHIVASKDLFIYTRNIFNNLLSRFISYFVKKE